MLDLFESVRQWKKIRGVGEDSVSEINTILQAQFQRVMQECIEIHEALVLNDEEEFIDAIGDTIVTLINIADIKGHNAEDCLKTAFDVIKLRKGITRDDGTFVRYAKLSQAEKELCDKLQGNPGEQYFDEEYLEILKPKHFKK